MATIPNARMGYYQRLRQAASAKGKRMTQARWSKPRESHPVDADTVRSRELHDRMGSLIIVGNHKHRGHFEVRHSLYRTNGFELWIEGRLVARSGKRKIMEHLL